MKYVKYFLAAVFLLVRLKEVAGMQYDLQRNQKFCGSSLTKTLSFFCLDYNTPHGRSRRNIASECCEAPCNLEYMLLNYCAKVNPHALEIAKLFNQRKLVTEEEKEKTENRKFRKKKHSRKRRERKCACGRHPKSEISEQKKNELLNRVVPSPRVGLAEHHTVSPLVIF